jgi:hypothetical protein
LKKEQKTSGPAGFGDAAGRRTSFLKPAGNIGGFLKYRRNQARVSGKPVRFAVIGADL